MITKIFAVINDSSLKTSDINLFLERTDSLKKQTILKQKNKHNADNSLIGIALVMYALKNTFNLSKDELKIGYKPSGKPYVINRDDLYISISHSNNLVVCAVSDIPVGIDCEYIRKYNFRISNKYFGFEITSKIESSANKDVEFTKQWTIAESISKISGEGILNIKNIIYDEYFVDTLYYNDYYISLAHKKTDM